MTEVLRPRQVSEMLHVSLMTLWRWRRDGSFPQPIPLGANSIGYLKSDLDCWLASRAAVRDMKQQRKSESQDEGADGSVSP